MYVEVTLKLYLVQLLLDYSITLDIALYYNYYILISKLLIDDYMSIQYSTPYSILYTDMSNLKSYDEKLLEPLKQIHAE